MTLADFVQHLYASDEYCREWQRLRGRTLRSSSPVNQMIDEATGYSEETMKMFVSDAVDLWLRLLEVPA